MKQCGHCNQKKEDSDFCGRWNICKKCDTEIATINYWLKNGIRLFSGVANYSFWKKYHAN